MPEDKIDISAITEKCQRFEKYGHTKKEWCEIMLQDSDTIAEITSYIPGVFASDEYPDHLEDNEDLVNSIACILATSIVGSTGSLHKIWNDNSLNIKLQRIKEDLNDVALELIKHYKAYPRANTQ